MAISSPGEPREAPGRDAGFTLFEMIVALAIGAVFAASLAGLSRTMSPRVELRATAERVAGDLERARLEARRTGAPVRVSVSHDGYDIPALSLSGDWGDAELGGRAARRAPFDLVMSPAPYAPPPGAVQLARQGFAARIAVAPISGRVEVELAET